MLTVGIQGQKQFTVTAAQTAEAVGSGGLPVFSTPSLVALMEATAMESVATELEAGQGTVGAAISVQHVSATPVGMAVRCESKLMAIDGRKLSFQILAYDEVGPIGTATHERVIIDNARFMEKAQAKLRS